MVIFEFPAIFLQSTGSETHKSTDMIDFSVRYNLLLLKNILHGLYLQGYLKFGINVLANTAIKLLQRPPVQLVNTEPPVTGRTLYISSRKAIQATMTIG